MKTHKDKFSIYKMVTDRLIEKIESSESLNWNSFLSTSYGMAWNYKSKKRYNINISQ